MRYSKAYLAKRLPAWVWYKSVARKLCPRLPIPPGSEGLGMPDVQGQSIKLLGWIMGSFAEVFANNTSPMSFN